MHKHRSNLYFREYIDRDTDRISKILQMRMWKTLKFLVDYSVERGSSYANIRMTNNVNGECVVDMIMTALYPGIQCQMQKRDRIKKQIKKIDPKYETGISCETIIAWIN
jgi:hypothetical protein